MGRRGGSATRSSDLDDASRNFRLAVLDAAQRRSAGLWSLARWTSSSILHPQLSGRGSRVGKLPGCAHARHVPARRAVAAARQSEEYRVPERAAVIGGTCYDHWWSPSRWFRRSGRPRLERLPCTPLLYTTLVYRGGSECTRSKLVRGHRVRRTDVLWRIWRAR
jgi:hypothetical protein